MSVLTVGHSTHSTQTLLGLLRCHDVTAVADVRSAPYSGATPWFNREVLRADLVQAGIGYVDLGRQLGARPLDPSCYVDGKVQFSLLAALPAFKQGLDRIERGSRRFRIALLCAEKEPLLCHRGVLIAPHLAARGIAVGHILADGRLWSQQQADTQILAEELLDRPELLRTVEERLAAAYHRRAETIAYDDRAAWFKGQTRR